MAKVKDLIEKRFKSVDEKYREKLGLVYEALGKPCIILHVQLPKGARGTENFSRSFRRTRSS
jgi:hypothetical protein